MSARKTVIFIGGSSYSGSTLLDMVLANSEMGFSCGEITALFYPYRDHHLAPICGCGSTNCTVWEIVRQRGLKNIYETIFDLFKDVNYIVDSSKDPLWIHDRTKDLQHGGIVVKNILIWKTPAEFFESKKKRGKTLAWRRAWINYHRLYFYLVKEWVGLPYRQLVTDPGVLERICEYLEIPYSNRQFDYWEKEHHTLFGNTSAKIHLYSKDTYKYQECTKELNSHDSNTQSPDGPDERHRSIYYKVSENKDNIGMSNSISQIVDILVSRDIRGWQSDEVITASGSKAAFFLYIMRRLKLRVMVIFLKAKWLISPRCSK